MQLKIMQNIWLNQWLQVRGKAEIYPWTSCTHSFSHQIGYCHKISYGTLVFNPVPDEVQDAKNCDEFQQ